MQQHPPTAVVNATQFSGGGASAIQQQQQHHNTSGGGASASCLDGLPVGVQVTHFYSSGDNGNGAVQAVNAWLAGNRKYKVLKVLHHIFTGWNVMFTIEFCDLSCGGSEPTTPPGPLRQVAHFFSSGDYGNKAVDDLNNWLRLGAGSRKVVEIHHNVFPGWNVMFTVDYIQL
ncbi:hypothetical protein Pelo_1242 [Pelomyxa schiedti]|nr:hypothetical protein Pelo_1242 [Pelomyxa schiedti]